MAATRRLAVCTIRLPVKFGDFEATGLLSTAASNPDDEPPEIQIIWIVSKVPYFSTLVNLDKASEPSIYRTKSGREIPYQMAQK